MQTPYRAPPAALFAPAPPPRGIVAWVCLGRSPDPPAWGQRGRGARGLCVFSPLVPTVSRPGACARPLRPRWPWRPRASRPLPASPRGPPRRKKRAAQGRLLAPPARCRPPVHRTARRCVSSAQEPRIVPLEGGDLRGNPPARPQWRASASARMRKDARELFA